MKIRRVQPPSKGAHPEQLSLLSESVDSDVAASRMPVADGAELGNDSAEKEVVLPPGSTRIRRRILAALMVIWCLAVVTRLGYLQIDQYENYAARKESQGFAVLKLDGPRGTIFDARGRKLAISVPAISVWANPREVSDPKLVVSALQKVLRLSANKSRSLLQSLAGDAQFRWVSRQIEPELGALVMELGLEGVYLQEEPKRYYPKGSLASHVLGFVGIDHDGLGGLEALYDDVIRGVTLERTIFKRGDGYVLDEKTMRELAENSSGAALQLTLDSSLQHLAERELKRMVDRTNAKGGSVVMLDSRDSAVLAMASWPTFDPNAVGSDGEARRNQAVAGAYEPGSTFKMITAATALEHVVLHPDDQFDCEMGGMRIGRTFIRDHKPFGILSFREVLEKSSNVGTMKAARLIGPERQLEMIEAFGMGEKTGIDLPAESSGELNLKHWDPSLDRTHWAYASFGQGISVTPIQLANAFATLARGGEARRPYVVRAIEQDGQRIDLTETSLDGGEPTAGQIVGRPISRQTAATLMRILEGVVVDGTAKAAQIEGYRVAGKTGTAEKLNRRGVMRNRKVASFAGVAPARDPRVVALVVLDEPHGLTHGGQVGAPVFSAMVGEALLYLGVPPSREGVETQVAWLTLPTPHPELTPASDPTMQDRLSSLAAPLRALAKEAEDSVTADRLPGSVGSSGGSR